MRIAAHGLGADLPDGWEGAIRAEHAEDLRAAGLAGGRAYPVAHLASFALPQARGDFGSGAVDHMTAADDFVALLEYGPEEVGTALFSGDGLPRRLDPRTFSPRALQRTLAWQAGLQHFFSEGGRAFCLYVVLGDAQDVHRHVRSVERVLAGLEIEERP